MKLSPLWIIEPVFQVYNSSTDQFITEKCVIIKYFQSQRRTTWECTIKLNDFVEYWVKLVHLIVVTIIQQNFRAMCNFEVGI